MKAQQDKLLTILRDRFEQNAHRHQGLAWADVQARLVSKPNALKSLGDMESSGGEPDVIGHDRKTGELTFCDCAAESPKGRRSLCYDRAALDARKEDKPKGSAVETAAAMGVDLLTEEQYRALQALGDEGLVESRRGLGIYVRPGAREHLRRIERERFLNDEWPQLRARLRRLGITADQLKWEDNGWNR